MGAASPALLLLLLLLLLAAAQAASLDTSRTGTDFLVAFPELIASFHPVRPVNKLLVFVTQDGTTVTITTYQGQTSRQLTKGKVEQFQIDASLELRRAGATNRAVHVTATNNVTVLAVSAKAGSMQTALVLPTHQLASEYLVPPAPRIQGTTVPASTVTAEVTERRPFSLVIVNGGLLNTVSVTGAEPVDLQPYHVHQLLLRDSDQVRRVTATEPVAVLFGHACAMRGGCACGPLYAALPPPATRRLRFYVPPVVEQDDAAEAALLLTEADSSRAEPYDPERPLVEAAGTAVLYRPGLLLRLLPEEDFASCFVVGPISNALSYALVLVHRDSTDGVYVGDAPLQDPDWKELKGTEYRTARLALKDDPSLVWHSEDNMAVYFLGQNVSLGNPAAAISRSPDFRGCVLTPEAVVIGEEAVSWQEAVQQCRDLDMELVSFPDAQLRQQIYRKILEANVAGVPEFWFGMRRGSLTGIWYWLSGEPVGDTDWLEGEPGAVHDGQCAMLSLQDGARFGWMDQDCCRAARPVCYGPPVLLTI